VVNVHLLSNLEPFRYGAQDYIRRCVLAVATGWVLRVYTCILWLTGIAYTPDKVNLISNSTNATGYG